jgi:protein TonB
MFEGTLLDSSPSAAPTLKRRHWLISLGIGVVVFLAVYFIVPMVSFGAETKIVVTQGIILGTLVGCYALMLCYVLADAKHLGLNGWVWFPITLVLNLVGFVLYLIYSAAKTDNWKRATIPIAYIVQFILVAATVLVPLIYTEALPKTQLLALLAAPPPPPPPPPPPAAAPAVKVIRRVTAEDLMKAPTVIPKTITKVKDEEEAPPSAGAFGVVGGVPGGVPGGQMGGVIGGVIGGVLSAATPPPPPPPPKPTTPKRIRVGGQVEAARLIFGPKPEYPPLAKMARISGTVKLEAIISRDGTIQDLRMISGHPLLVKAAMEAVGRWRYQPTLLNGEPVEVVTEIDVNFTLAE